MGSPPKSFKLINSSLLIEEIKKRPVLYDPKITAASGDFRKVSWEEVASTLFSFDWPKLQPQEKEALVRELQTRWKSLRDNFTRVLRREKEDEILTGGSSNAKRKKYIYYDQLMFLAPYCNRKTLKSPDVIYLEENKDSNDSFPSPEENNPLQNLQYMQLQPNSTTCEEDEEGPSVPRKLSAILEEVVAMQKEDRNDDPMGNKKFLLSLLPFLRKLPDDVNLEVRLQLMSVLQTYSSRKGFLS